MSLIYRSLEQLRRQQAAAEPGAMPAQQPKPKRGGRMRRIIALMAGAFLLLGIGLMGVVWYLGDDVEMIAKKQPKGVTMVDAAKSKRSATRKTEDEQRARQKALEEERIQAEERAKAEAQERALAELEARRKAKEEAERKAREEQAALEAQAALAALETPEPPAGNGAANGVQAPVSPAISPPAPDQALDRDRALDSHFMSQAQRNMRIQSIEKSLSATAKTNEMDSVQEQVTQLTTLVGEQSLAAHKWKGFMAMKQHRYATAVKHLTAALAMAPDNLETRYNLTLALLKTQDFDKAEQVFAPLKEQHGDDKRIQLLGSHIATIRSPGQAAGP